jgi:hypothetical protein
MAIRSLLTMSLLREELKVLAVLTNSSNLLELVKELSGEELNSRMVSKDKMRKYGLKGSPKLSQMFLSCGISEKLVSLAFSFKAKGDSYISTDLADLYDQGNSVYYCSCQGTDRRSKWFTEASGSAEFLKIYGDQPYLGKSLFLWVVGKRMSLDGKGFRARAKLRLIYQDSQDWFGNRVIAVYVDKIYGDTALLKADFPLLKEWVRRNYGEVDIVSATSQWYEKRQFNYSETVYCPSAAGGYQDSCADVIPPTINFRLLSSKKESYFLYKYQLRKREAGAYTCRTGDLEVKVEERRPHLTSKTRELIQEWISILGYPDKKSCFRGGFTPRTVGEFVLKGTKHGLTLGLVQDEMCIYQMNGDERTALVQKRYDMVNVISTFTELGFYPAVGIERYAVIKSMIEVVGIDTPIEVYRDSLEKNIYRVVIGNEVLSYDAASWEFRNKEGVVVVRENHPEVTIEAFEYKPIGLQKGIFVSERSYFDGFDLAVPLALKAKLRLEIKNVSKQDNRYSFFTEKFVGDQFYAFDKECGYLITDSKGTKIAFVSKTSFEVLQDNEELGLLKASEEVRMRSLLSRLRKLLKFLTK